jgi:hypothetical protein
MAYLSFVVPEKTSRSKNFSDGLLANALRRHRDDVVFVSADDQTGLTAVRFYRRFLGPFLSRRHYQTHASLLDSSFRDGPPLAIAASSPQTNAILLFKSALISFRRLDNGRTFGRGELFNLSSSYPPEVLPG